MDHTNQAKHRQQIPSALAVRLGRLLFILCNIPLLGAYSVLAYAHDNVDDTAYSPRDNAPQFEAAETPSRSSKRYTVSGSKNLDNMYIIQTLPIIERGIGIEKVNAKVSFLSPMLGRDPTRMEELLLVTTAVLVLILLAFVILRYRSGRRNKNIQPTVSETNNLFATAFDKSPLMMAIVHLPNCIIDMANDAMLKTLGYERDEVIGKSTTDIGLVNERVKTDNLQQMRQLGQSSLNIEFHTRSGELRHGKLSANLANYHNYHAALLIIEDTTDFYNSEEALRNSELQFRTIFEHSFSGIVLADHKGNLITINSAFANITGYDRDELCGVSFRDISYPQDLPGEEKLLNKILTGESDSYQYKKRLLRKDGSLAWIEIALNVIRNEQGSPYLFVGVVNDISEQLNAEKEKALLQKQLQQSQKMESIGQLTGGIAHDFNNILAAILGFAELSRTLYSESIPDKLNDYLGEIISTGQRARNIVEQLLIFSRGTTRGAELIDPKPVLEQAVEFIRTTLPSTVELHTQLDTRPAQIYASAAQLNQVLLNLVLNARQAIKESGEIQITSKQLNLSHANCASCHKDINGKFLAIEVCDNGQGIAAVMIPRIFEPFFTTREMGQGSGMGLSMVHGIIHSAKGHIRIFPSRYGGACIQLLLPLQEMDTTETTGSHIDNGVPAEFSAHGRHILVVDDELPITALLKDILTLHGYRVTVFNDPQQALQAFRSNPEDVDLLLTDQTMPSMNGTELAAQLRALRPGIPVVLCTGYSKLIQADNISEFEIDQLLYKPLDRKQLLDTIDGLLAAKAG